MDYIKFNNLLTVFREFFGLEKYILRDIDKYLWLLGKEFFR